MRSPDTPGGFTAWKTAAWLDRAAPRDLYDLWALARIGALDATAAALLAAHGRTNTAPRRWMFTTAPTEDAWRAQLAAQTRLQITAAQALADVARAWAAAVGDGGDENGR